MDARDHQRAAPRDCLRSARVQHGRRRRGLPDSQLLVRSPGRAKDAKAAPSDARRVLYGIDYTPIRLRLNPSAQTVIDLPHRMFYIPVLEVVACSPPVIRMRQRTISSRML